MNWNSKIISSTANSLGKTAALAGPMAKALIKSASGRDEFTKQVARQARSK